MKKCIERLTPYFAGLYFPLLFAVQVPSELTIWRKMALWMAVHVLLLVILEFAGRRVKAGRPLVDAAGLWLALFVQVFLCGLTEPAAIDFSERIRAGFLFLCVIMVFVMILSICFVGNRPVSAESNTLRLTLLMLIMPVALMIVGVFNRIFFFIGLGWGLLTLFVMFLRKMTDWNEPKPEAGAPEGASQESALAVIGRWLSYLALAGVLVLMAFALKQIPRTPKPASEEEIARYRAYDMDIEAVKKAAGKDEAKAAILAFCEFDRQETIGELTWDRWKPNGLEAFLPEAEKVTGIEGEADGGLIYLSYEAKDGKVVMLDYGSAEGKAIDRITVYDPKTDIAFGMIGEEYYIWRHFHGGSAAPAS